MFGELYESYCYFKNILFIPEVMDFWISIQHLPEHELLYQY